MPGLVTCSLCLCQRLHAVHACTEAYRLRRGMAWALGLAVVLGFVANIYFVLSLCYTYGAGNFGSWYFTAGGGLEGWPSMA